MILVAENLLILSPKIRCIFVKYQGAQLIRQTHLLTGPSFQMILTVRTPNNSPSIIFLCVVIAKAGILVSDICGLNPASDTYWMLISHLFILTKPQFPLK